MSPKEEKKKVEKKVGSVSTRSWFSKKSNRERLTEKVTLKTEVKEQATWISGDIYKHRKAQIQEWKSVSLQQSEHGELS